MSGSEGTEADAIGWLGMGEDEGRESFPRHPHDINGKRCTSKKTAAQVRGENRGRMRVARRNETPEQAEERKRKNRERMRAKRAKGGAA